MYDSDGYGETALARRIRRRRKIFGWVALAGLSAMVLGGSLSQIFN